MNPVLLDTPAHLFNPHPLPFLYNARFSSPLDFFFYRSPDKLLMESSGLSGRLHSGNMFPGAGRVSDLLHKNVV